MVNKEVEIGNYVMQPQGYKAFMPNHFPPSQKIVIGEDAMIKHLYAVQALSRLDGISTLVPDINCFLEMFVLKDAASSAQIEGTRATMTDAIEAGNVERPSNIPVDTDDIIHYKEALKYGVANIEKGQPITLRFIRNIHKELMTGARETQYSYPGEFRMGQNWIGGPMPSSAKFVPPPHNVMMQALGDLELFINSTEYNAYPLIKVALIHSQFETIHPFNDGNGRTGRMLITLYLLSTRQIAMPVLYLSSYFRKFQDVYYAKISGYHDGNVSDWFNFFLDAVVDVAESATVVCNGISILHDRDYEKIAQFAKSPSQTSAKILKYLFSNPIVGIADVTKVTGLSRVAGYSAIQRLVDVGILCPRSSNGTYGQKWEYRDYINLFEKAQ